jgi:hypothetical protein
MGRNARGERGKKFKQVNKDGKDENCRKHIGGDGNGIGKYTVRNFICGHISSPEYQHGKLKYGEWVPPFWRKTLPLPPSSGYLSILKMEALGS